MTRDVLSRKVAKVEDKLQRIAELLPADFAAFAANRSARDLCAFYLAMAIEDCIDIAEHLIAERGWGAPDSSGAGFRLLAEKGVFDRALGDQMAQASGMHNAILHEYDDIDWRLVFDALNDPQRIRAFVVAVKR